MVPLAWSGRAGRTAAFRRRSSPTESREAANRFNHLPGAPPGIRSRQHDSYSWRSRIVTSRGAIDPALISAAVTRSSAKAVVPSTLALTMLRGRALMLRVPTSSHPVSRTGVPLVALIEVDALTILRVATCNAGVVHGRMTSLRLSSPRVPTNR